MIQNAKKWISLALALVLFVVILPLPAAKAAGGSIVISNLYTGNYTEPYDSANDASVPRLTSNPTAVKANITNVSDSEITNIFYEVTNVSSGTVTAEKSNKAVKTGSNEITFQSVDLSEGLNKVVLRLGETSGIFSNPAWVYFTPTTTLSDIEVNDVAFVPDTIYPVGYNEGESAIVIKGKSNNSDVVSAYNVGMDSFAKTSAPDNDSTFYFIGDESINKEYANSPQVIALRGGDNYIEFEAKNSSNNYKIEKNLIYDSGKPFPYLTKLVETGDSTSGDGSLLVRSLNSFDTQSLTLSTKVKADLIDKSTVTEHTYMEVQINSSRLFKFDLHGGDVTSGVITTSSGTGGSYSVKKNASESTSRYNVYDVLVDITEIPELKTAKQTLTFVFDDVLDLYDDSDSSFTFNYLGTDKPLIENVKRSNGAVLTEDVVNEFSVLPDTIIVETNADATGVLFIIDDDTANPLTGTQSGHQYTFTVSNLTEGDHKFVIQPKYDDDSNGSTPDIAYSPGGKTLKVRVSNAPFIIAKNIYNGMLLDDATKINNFYTSGIIGEAVNFAAGGPTDGNNVRVYLNDNLIADTSTSTLPWESGSYKFTVALDASVSAKALVEGKNIVRFEIDNNNNLIRSQSYEIYKLAQKTPYFKDVVPEGAGSTFIKAQSDDKYATEEGKVTFIGSLFNADSVSLVMYYKDSKGQDATKSLSASLSGNALTAGPFDLQLESDVRFEFTAKNSHNLTATQSITILREPVPYTLVAPKTFKNEKGLKQANINGNFVEIIIEADNATSVLIGKETAEAVEGTTNRYAYTLKGLKTGANNVKFTVVRGTEKAQGSLIVFNANTNIVGAAYLMSMANNMKLFDGNLQLSFPKGTLLKRYEPNSDNESFLSASRSMMFGIADSEDGRVDLNESSKGIAKSRLTSTMVVNRFSPASPLYWIDGGIIGDSPSSSKPDEVAEYRQESLTGRGLDPYDDSNSSFFFTRDPEDQVVPSNKGELTIKFDQNIRYDAWKYVTVFQFSIDEGVTGSKNITWKNIGGVVDMKNNSITVPVDKFGYYQVMYMDKSYDDVTTHGYARDAMDILYSKGVMNGKSDYTFSTTESITRGEFASMLVKIFEIPLNYEGNATFGDVPKALTNTLYEYKYIETAARAGIVRGTSQSFFNPNRSIARQDAAVMIARAAELKLQTDLAKAKAAVEKAFTDGSSIESYSAPAVDAVVKAGLIEGIANVLTDGQKKQKETVRFEPTQNFSRADAAIVAVRVLANQKKIPK